MKIRDRINNFLFVDNCYTIAIRERNSDKGLLFEGNNEKFSVLPISVNTWYADPICFSYHGKDYLFCEVYDRKNNIGNIGVSEITSKGVITKPKNVLEVGFHLSYPCVFQIEQEVYMIPETTNRDNIQLYKAIEFPYKWDKVTELINGAKYADSTYFSDENRTILLTFLQQGNDCNITKLCIYDASAIRNGKLSELSSNQFNYDCESRGAGKLFTHRGKLWRPSQICKPEYGYALRINEVFWNGQDYQEEKRYVVYPDEINANIKKKILGIHTYSISERYEIIDLKFNDPRLKYQLRRLKKFLRRILRKII